MSLRLTAAPVRDALDLMCLMAEADWDITNGVVFVSTAMEMTRRRIETRVYDIRGMLIAVQNQVVPTLDLVDALSNTNSGGGGGRQSKSGGGGGSVFGDETSVESMMTRTEMVDSIISLIEDGMGELAEINGGDFKVSEINGTLVIRATPESHEQAGELLGSLEQQAGKMVQVQSEFFVLPRTVLDRLIHENGGSLVVGPDRLAELHLTIPKRRRAGWLRHATSGSTASGCSYTPGATGSSSRTSSRCPMPKGWTRR